jgi:transposase
MTGMQLTSIFCFIDDFCKQILPELRKNLICDGKKFRVRTDCLSESEIITILIWFNLSGFNCFKHFYLSNQSVLKLNFPKIPCYERFIILQKKSFVLTNILLRFLTSQSKRTDVYYIDSTFLEVCKNKIIYRHKTFKGLAARGVSSCGWFYGFKLHLITNHLGEIVSFAITKGNVSDQKMTQKLSKNLSGFLFGDKGYLSAKTSKDLLKQGLHLITKVRQNMKPKPISESNKFLLRRRGIIETIFGQLKDFRHLVHTKYRSKINYFTNILSSLLAYMLNPNKPRICLNWLSVG